MRDVSNFKNIVQYCQASCQALLGCNSLQPSNTPPSNLSTQPSNLYDINIDKIEKGIWKFIIYLKIFLGKLKLVCIIPFYKKGKAPDSNN